MTDRRVGRTDVVQTEHTSLQLAPRAREPTLQCDCCWTHQRISRCLPTAAETARLCRHREVLQRASVSPAVATYHTISLPAFSALTYCRVLFNQLTHFRPPCVIIICLMAATTGNRAYDKCTEPSNDQKTAWLATSQTQYHVQYMSLHCALASSAVYCNRSCLCVCGGRVVSEPYYSQRTCWVCVSLSTFFHLQLRFQKTNSSHRFWNRQPPLPMVMPASAHSCPLSKSHTVVQMISYPVPVLTSKKIIIEINR